MDRHARQLEVGSRAALAQKEQQLLLQFELKEKKLRAEIEEERASFARSKSLWNVRMKKAADEITRIKKIQAEEPAHRPEKSLRKQASAAQRNTQRQEEAEHSEELRLAPGDPAAKKGFEENFRDPRKSSSTCRSAVSKSMKQDRPEAPYEGGPSDSFRGEQRQELERKNAVPEIPLANLQERVTASWGDREHPRERAQTLPAAAPPNHQDIDEYIQTRINERRRREDDHFVQMLTGTKPVELDHIVSRPQSQFLKAREETLKAHDLLDLEIKQTRPDPQHIGRSAISDFANQAALNEDSHQFSVPSRSLQRDPQQQNPFRTSTDAKHFNRALELPGHPIEAEEDSIKVLRADPLQQTFGWRPSSLAQVKQPTPEIDSASPQMPFEKPDFRKKASDPDPAFGKKGSSQTGHSIVSSCLVSPHTQHQNNISSLATPPLTSDRHYQNLVRTNQALPTPALEKPAGSRLLAEVFSEAQTDDQKTASLKSERLQVLRRVQDSDSKLPVVNSLIARLTSVCPRLIELGVLWRDCLVCGQSQVDFLERLRSMEVSETRERTNLEIDYWTGFKMRNDEALSKLRRRDAVRGQIASIAMEFDSLRQIEEFNRATSSCFNVLRAVDKNLIKRNKELLYKGLKVEALIKLDLFEEEHLRKAEHRLSAREKYF